jgi:hypothetical protein
MIHLSVQASLPARTGSLRPPAGYRTRTMSRRHRWNCRRMRSRRAGCQTMTSRSNHFRRSQTRRRLNTVSRFRQGDYCLTMSYRSPNRPIPSRQNCQSHRWSKVIRCHRGDCLKRRSCPNRRWRRENHCRRGDCLKRRSCQSRCRHSRRASHGCRKKTMNYCSHCHTRGARRRCGMARRSRRHDCCSKNQKTNPTDAMRRTGC